MKIPEEKSLHLPNNAGTFVLNTKIEKNRVQLYFKINFKQATYQPVFYDSLKGNTGKIVDLQKNSLIVIQKK